MKIKFLKAHKGDSIIISFIDDIGKNRNILIDGGVSGTYYDSRYNRYGALKLELAKIRDAKEKVDLLILSHIDNDHIEGILKWFEIDKEAHSLIKQVWFNSGKSISEYYKESKNTDLKVTLDTYKSDKTGVKEALEFEKYLLDKEIWNKKIISKGYQLEIYGAVITVLTPTELQLKKLVKEYKKKTGDNIYTGGKKDWHIDLKDCIALEEKDHFKFSQDTSVKNGSSITVLFSFKEKNYLFLGDSHPKEVCDSLQELGHNKKCRLKVELFQISHHGSKANMNKELLEIINTQNYVISTDSSIHGHPHKSVLARIINVNPEATIHFNYEYVLNNVFTYNDRKDFPDFQTTLISEYIVKE